MIEDAMKNLDARLLFEIREYYREYKSTRQHPPRYVLLGDAEWAILTAYVGGLPLNGVFVYRGVHILHVNRSACIEAVS